MQLRFSQLERFQDQFVAGLVTTVELTLVCIVAGLLIGLACSGLQQRGQPMLRRFIHGYVEIFRNTPSLIQLFVFYFLLPDAGILLTPFGAASVALSLYFGAYMTEIIRSGLDSIPAAQSEAGACLGLSTYQIYRHIVLGPALRNIYPSMVVQIIILLLGTSLASQISVNELFHAATFVESRSYLSFEVYAVLCIIYFCLVLAAKLLTFLIGRLAFRWPIRR